MPAQNVFATRFMGFTKPAASIDNVCYEGHQRPYAVHDAFGRSPQTSVGCGRDTTDVKMWLPRKQDVCVVLMLISMGQAVLIVGPKSLRANRDYTVVISNFFGEVTDAELLLRFEGRNANGQVLFAVEKPVEVLQNTNEIISFQIPLIVSPGIYKMIIEGVNSFVYHDEIELEYLHKSISGLIQLRQPVFKPGDSVQFRVIVLDPDLKPPSGLKMVTVTVQDSNGNNIRKWSDAQLYNGVFEGQLDIAPSPLLGTYNIKVEANVEELVSKTFEVKEYVLPTFKMDVFPTVTPLEEHQALNLTIVAKYYVGNPAIGRVKVQLYDGDNNLDLSKEYDVNGMLQVHLPFTNELILYGEQENVRVNVTFTERNTNRAVVQMHHIAIYKENYQVRLLGAPVFNALSSNAIKLAIECRDGKPAKQLTLKISIASKNTELNHMYTSDNEGIITLDTLSPFSSADELEMTVLYSNRVLFETTLSKGTPASHRLKIEIETHK